MGRSRAHIPLNIFLNNKFVGRLIKQSSGAIEFKYDDTWLAWEYAMPISLSLPLRTTPFRGQIVTSVFENLLPDSEPILRRMAEKVGAEGIDYYSLLTKIGRDCVGALQFLPDDIEVDALSEINGEVVSEGEIEAIIKNLARAPLGLREDDGFRISVAGAQEKTALLWHDGQWKKPKGTTPTTHIFKPQMGKIETSEGTIDLSNSVENEYYCLKLIELFGLKTNKVEIAQFGEKKVLIIERFDRRWTKDNRLLRLPQEDCCQALGVPPSQKYQNHGGPSVVQILEFLKGSDTPNEDIKAFFKSQILFWLMGATDGHGKNFSVFLNQGGRYNLTPFYDVLTAQPSFDAKQIRHKDYKLAMSIGNNRKYKILDIHKRHFVETAKEANIGENIIEPIFEEIIETGEQTLNSIEKALPTNFPENIHESVKASVLSRIKILAMKE